MKHQLMVVINLGGPHAQIVARRVRECNVYCEVYSFTAGEEKIKALSPKGIIVTGGWGGVPELRHEKAPWLDNIGVPVLEVGHGTAVSVEALAGGIGKKCLDTFLKTSCDCIGDWSIKEFVNDAIAEIRSTVGDGRVLLGLSGGVDSSVLAALLSKAIGERLICIFVDTGLMRKEEGNQVEAAFSGRNMTFSRVNAETKFLFKLVGVSDPEKKRKIIGEEFIRVFEREAAKFGDIEFLAQGTIYPDIIESGGDDGQVVKSHHNVGGLPDTMQFKGLVEPLKFLFKDEVRKLALELGLPEYIAYRQPFPGPGLAVRCIGAITKERLEILREADAIFAEEIEKAGLSRKIGQYFAIISDTKSTGVRNEHRTYEYTIALRAVNTTDFMTAQWVELPFELIRTISRRITTEVKSVNRVLYDVTDKPPATIEWE